MKNYRFGYFIILAALLLFGSCKPDQYELGSLLQKEDLVFTVTPHEEEPNMIILNSNNPGAAPFWETPLGRSTKPNDTVKIAFPGSYEFQFSAMCGGGIVKADPLTIEIDEPNFDYIKDPMWVLLSGGVGHEKTWYLDLDAEGVSRYFLGPLYFAGMDMTYDYECKEDGEDCWSWDPDYAGNSWLMEQADFGSMTFSLRGSADVQVTHLTLGGVVENGSYNLDSDTKQLMMYDAGILHDPGRDGEVSNWGNIRIMSITEDAMQLAVHRNLSDEGDALLVYNFISQKYYDEWIPEETGDPDIEVDLGGGNADDALATTKTKVWALDAESPFDWATLTGELMNDWQNVGSYPDWAGYRAEHQDFVGNCTIKYFGTGDVIFTDGDGTITAGTYSTDNTTNIITFESARPSFAIGDWQVATTTEENQWRIVKTVTVDGEVTEMWMGSRDPEAPQYTVFHFVAQEL
ncbi:hypothetical protein [Persicobacter diffluens]